MVFAVYSMSFIVRVALYIVFCFNVMLFYVICLSVCCVLLHNQSHSPIPICSYIVINNNKITGSCGSVVVKALCYKPEDREFETR
jgi:hypothetical protein